MIGKLWKPNYLLTLSYTILGLVHSKGVVILTQDTRAHSTRISKVDLYKLSQVGEAKEETQNFDSEGRSLISRLRSQAASEKEDED